MLTRGYQGITFIILNRGSAVNQVVNFSWYYGNKSNGQQWVWQVRLSGSAAAWRHLARHALCGFALRAWSERAPSAFARARRRASLRNPGQLMLMPTPMHNAASCTPTPVCKHCSSNHPDPVQGNTKFPCLNDLPALAAVPDAAVPGRQSHTGYNGSPDSDPSPMFTQWATNPLIVNNQITVWLPTASLTVLEF